MFKIFLLVLCGCSTAMAGQSVSKLAFSETRSSVSVTTAQGEKNLQAATMQLSLPSWAGREWRGNLAVIYDPETKFYLWHIRAFSGSFETTNLLKHVESGVDALYSAPFGLVDFSMPGNLFVLKSTRQAERLDAAVDASIDEVQRNVGALQREGYDPGFEQVEVAPAIGRPWACASVESVNFDPTCEFHVERFISIEHSKNQWRLVVRNRWDQEVLLTDDFRLLSTRQVASK